MTKIPKLEGGPKREAAIKEKLHRMPRMLRRKYLRAVTRTSRLAAMSAFCDECMGYQIREIPDCTALDCPLWAWRRRSEVEEEPEEVA